MRAVGLCASLIAVAQLVSISTAAFAADNPPPSSTASAAASDASPDKKPAKPGKKKKNVKKPKKGASTPDAVVVAPPPTPEPPAPAPPSSPSPATVTLTSAEVPAPVAVTGPIPAAKTEDKPAAQEDSTVEVHIDSPRVVSLEKRSADRNWEKACDSPCDARLGVSDEYRVIGKDMNESNPFRLDATKNRVVLTVDPGTPGGQTRGMWTTIGSGAVLVGGVVVILLGVTHHGSSDGELSQPTNDGALLAGGAMVFAGIVGGIVGTSWIVTNAHTGVEGDVSSATKDRAARTAGLAPAYRQPTWSTAKQIGVPAITTVPFLNGTF